MPENRLLHLLTLGMFSLYTAALAFFLVRLVQDFIIWSENVFSPVAWVPAAIGLALLPLMTVVFTGMFWATRLKAWWITVPVGVFLAAYLLFSYLTGSFLVKLIVLGFIIPVAGLPAAMIFRMKLLLRNRLKADGDINEVRSEPVRNFLENLCGKAGWRVLLASPRLKKYWLTKSLPRLGLMLFGLALAMLIAFSGNSFTAAMLFLPATVGAMLTVGPAAENLDPFEYVAEDAAALKRAGMHQTLWTMRALLLIVFALLWFLPAHDGFPRNEQAVIFLAINLPLFIPRVFLRALLRIRAASAPASVATSEASPEE